MKRVQHDTIATVSGGTVIIHREPSPPVCLSCGVRRQRYGDLCAVCFVDGERAAQAARA